MNILDLEKECFCYMINFLGSDDIYSFYETCKYFRLSIKEKKIIRKQPSLYYVSESVEKVKWAESHSKFKYSLSLAKFASRRNNLELLKYLYRKKCPFNSMVLSEAIDNKNIKIIKWFLKNNIEGSNLCFHKACIIGDLTIIKLLKKYNIDGDYIYESCLSAVYGNNIHLLKWLIKDGYSFDICSYIHAAGNGNIKILKYLLNVAQHDLSYIWFDYRVCAEAAKYGKLKTLKWLRKKGCQWDVYTTYLAYKHNKLDVLKWAIKNKCQIYEGLLDLIDNSNILKIDRNLCNVV